MESPGTSSRPLDKASCYGAVNDPDRRPRKRQRAASDPHVWHHGWDKGVKQPGSPPPPPPPPPPPNLVRDPEFWFEDGSVVLFTYGVGFRVYKRLLSEHSPVFRDLFHLPQAEPAPLMEGVPCVPLLEDPPETIRHLLRVLFPTNGNITLDRREVPLSMDAVAAIVRLSHKYQIESLFAQGLALLTEYYTDSFEEWTNVHRPLPIAALDIDAISAINIAHLTWTPSILPLAFLAVSRTGAALGNGCVRGDGRWLEGLCYQDNARVLKGSRAWAEASSTALARIFAPKTSLGCRREHRCRMLFARNMRGFAEHLQTMYASPALCAWAVEFNESEWNEDSESESEYEYEDDDDGPSHKLCDSCRKMVDARTLTERKKLWNALPGMFDLLVEEWGAK